MDCDQQREFWADLARHDAARAPTTQYVRGCLQRYSPSAPCDLHGAVSWTGVHGVGVHASEVPDDPTSVQ